MYEVLHNVKKEYEDKLAKAQGKTTKSRVVTMKFDVNEIEFDLDDSEEYKLTFDEEIALRDMAWYLRSR